MTENLAADTAGQRRPRSASSTAATTPIRSASRTSAGSIVGGTIEESGIPTIGIAQSIDPGNFDHGGDGAGAARHAVASRATDDSSFNDYIKPDSDRVEVRRARRWATSSSHEAGHYLGNWHVDQFNDVPNLMDQGGNFPLLFGVGPDKVGGTADDPDVDFGEDILNPNEGFTGIEDTLTRVTWALHP